jgi:HEAT repeat protein
MQMELREILPGLRLPGGKLATYYHASGIDLKERIVRDLQSPGLQLALFHAHGAPDAQYLLGAQTLPSTDSQINAIQLSLRQRLRDAREQEKSPAETQLDLMERLDLPLSWFKNAFDEAVIAADEAAAARKDLTAPEIALLVPTPQVMLLDQCFNGRFIDSPSVAQEYVHANGSVLVVVANTVNVRQDQWAAQFLGVLAHGARVGQYHRLHPYIEYHLIGDPTVRFAPETDLDLSTVLHRNPDERVWRAWLAQPEPSLRALAVYFLARSPDSEAALLEYLSSDPSPVVRMEALRSLAASRSEAFHKGLRIGLADPFEAVRRQSAALMGDVGFDSFARPLLEAAIGDSGRRVAFNASGALDKLRPEAVEAAAAEFLAHDPLAAADATLRERLDRILQPGPVRSGDTDVLENRDEPLKKRIQAARSFRNLRAHDLAGRLLAVALAPDEEPTLRVAVIEALGWFTLSHRMPEILEGVQKLADDSSAPEEVRAEAQRTRARLLAGPNEPWTP